MAHVSNSKEYMREYMATRYNDRLVIAHLVLGPGCSFCGSGETLQVDHIDWRHKELTFGQMTKVSIERFMEELVKCQLLCQKCHISKSKKDLAEIRKVQPGRNQFTGPRDAIYVGT